VAENRVESCHFAVSADDMAVTTATGTTSCRTITAKLSRAHPPPLARYAGMTTTSRARHCGLKCKGGHRLHAVLGGFTRSTLHSSFTRTYALSHPTTEL
jgi:hypothetical protein